CTRLRASSLSSGATLSSRSICSTSAGRRSALSTKRSLVAGTNSIDRQRCMSGMCLLAVVVCRRFKSSELLQDLLGMLAQGGSGPPEPAGGGVQARDDVVGGDMSEIGIFQRHHGFPAHYIRMINQVGYRAHRSD